MRKRLDSALFFYYFGPVGRLTDTILKKLVIFSKNILIFLSVNGSMSI